MIKSFAQSLLRIMPLMWSRSLRFRYYTGKWPRLRHPVGINEKINWRILYDHRDIWNWCGDKLESKDRAASLSPGILMPTVLWAGADIAELAALNIRGRWILKSNRSSKDVVVGQGAPDLASLARAVAEWDDFQWRSLGEGGYRNARHFAVLERWIGDSDAPPLDYKIHVYDGVARYVQVHSDRFERHRSSIFTRDWQRIEARQDHILPDEHDVPHPEHLDELLTRAEQIGAGFDYVRIDLFDTPEGVWFGEVSPYSWSGFRPFHPESVEVEFGSHWTLPDRKSIKRRRRAE